MVLAALSTAEQTMWLIALGIGLVVVFVVIALLTLLMRFVRFIDDRVAIVWGTAIKVAANTATTWQLQTTVNTVRLLDDELTQHALALEKAGSQ
jgi:hypothetical protein